MLPLSLDIGNYYGDVQIVEKDGKYYIRIGDYTGEYEKKEIRKETYEMLKQDCCELIN